MDTVTLAVELPLPFKKPRIPFNVPTYSTSNQNGVIEAHLNVSAAERRAGVYRPSFTYYQNPPGTNKPRYVMYVKFSVPKLIYGNNLQEAYESHRSKVISRIKQELERIGLALTEEQIRNTEVTKLDIAKNIIFRNHVSTSQIIKDLETADISTVYDVARDRFGNGGKSWRLHTNTEEVVVYDKIYDLMHSKVSEKRAIENDNYSQHHLLNQLSRHNELSVIRLEVRLNTKKKIRDTLARAGVANASLRFDDLFSTDLSRRVLKYEWQSILDRIPKVPLLEDTPDGLFVRILSDETATPLKALAKLGLLWLLSTKDTRYIRNLFDERFGQHAWGRIKGSRDPPPGKQLENLLHISKTIEDMQPVDIDEISSLPKI